MLESGKGSLVRGCFVRFRLRRTHRRGAIGVFMQRADALTHTRPHDRPGKRRR
ncbi:hypothetical protein SCATT_p08090 (plasmid) [Streptantibioticus cattleyicolor NRRL 8057 = DSM 46488]|uniref:Uncharacterized protein n=1 Tax=Streptantibioticus cattleyicolor (strain ATCC 35852 / DSM 46488 / JCM 4925 / NBRC 14057 / NRRL 8057) TaxID=1003195 RepID=G8XD56_STREN|nr:hypothetical protein SCATT_p08090 [Streptantibioticus cattleyicolor NRRL 8057 = DSM 46488]